MAHVALDTLVEERLAAIRKVLPFPVHHVTCHFVCTISQHHRPAIRVTVQMVPVAVAAFGVR